MYYGSEFINYTVAKLLGKLLIEQTKSRAHHTGDNGLVECKNGAIIRKHIGFGYIDARHAEAMDSFHRQHLNPYVNFHRPCAVPKILTEANGKRRRVYLRWATPFELFQEVPCCENLLRPCTSSLPAKTTYRGPEREICILWLQFQKLCTRDFAITITLHHERRDCSLSLRRLL